jgi:3',5'-cyclic AMP phosphodiesterase CpdA
LAEACSEQGGTAASTGPLSFVQISDTHIGFNKPANPDPAATLRAVFEDIRALPVQPRFILHTGDITHLATPEEFDTARQILGEINIPSLRAWRA